MSRVACMIVTYNPSKKNIENISNYAKIVDRVYVVDNSENNSNDIINRCKKHNNVIYMSNNGNKGIAHALNRGSLRAYREGYEWILTMDQDSIVPESSYCKIVRELENVKKDVAVVSMNYYGGFKTTIKAFKQVSEEKVLITSGSMVRLEAWKKVKGYTNKLFIYSVDHDFIRKMYESGYTAIKYNNIYFKHNIGNKSLKNGIVVYNYQPKTYYYITRNLSRELYMCGNKHIEEKKILLLWKRSIILSALNEKRKVSTIFFMIKGYIDYLTGRYGKYEDNWK